MTHDGGIMGHSSPINSVSDQFHFLSFSLTLTRSWNHSAGHYQQVPPDVFLTYRGESNFTWSNSKVIIPCSSCLLITSDIQPEYHSSYVSLRSYLFQINLRSLWASYNLRLTEKYLYFACHEFKLRSRVSIFTWTCHLTIISGRRQNN